MATDDYVQVASLEEVRKAGCLSVRVGEHTLALFQSDGKIFAVDNRCPHMGFPLHRGSVRDGILTCHWHHARFDLASGGTFDPWADDVRVFQVEIRNGEVWVNLKPQKDELAHQRQRLRDGLERDIPLVIGKSIIAMVGDDGGPNEPFRIGLKFGTNFRQAGWGPGLTIHTCMMNLLPHLDGEERPRALFHGLAAVSRDCADEPPRFRIQPLPSSTADVETLKSWFRRFVEVRDAEGAERCVVSAIRSGAAPEQLAGMLFAAATDHRFINVGHVLDFTNKALEALDAAGWDYAEPVLTSLISEYAGADRMEESNAWRNPEDLIAILEAAFDALPSALDEGRNRRGTWSRSGKLVEVLLGEDPEAIVDNLLDAVREGATEVQLGAEVAYSAALRIARFHTSNEFSDWDTALHTFSYANAVHQGLRRVASPELLRGAFDAAMSVYLDRFLNVPAVSLVEPEVTVKNPGEILDELPDLFDRQQQVNQAGDLVGRYLYSGGDPKRLMALLGKLLLREDRDFHTIQVVEAAFRQHSLLKDVPAKVNVLVAATRYLAAHAQTVRAQGQTYQIALRLHRGERLYEDA